MSVCMAAEGLVPTASQNHYKAIPDRNLFGLKPPEQVRNEPAPPQLPKLLLTGITTILGDKRALLKALPPAGKPGEQPKEQSFILSEGQREGQFEVLSIDENAGSVKVNNSGTVMTLTFDKDGVKLPSTPPLPNPPGALPLVTNGMPLRAGLPTAGATPPLGIIDNPKFKKMPNRNLRLPATSGSVSPPASAAAAFAQPGAEAVSPPTGGPTGLTPTPNLPPDLTPEEQKIVSDLQRQTEQQNAQLPPLPGTTLVPGASASSPTAAGGYTTPSPDQLLPQ